MGTRSAIAFKKDENYIVIHCHWDGYPSGLGKTLWDTVNESGTEALYKQFETHNKSEWSVLTATNLKAQAIPRTDNAPDDNERVPIYYPASAAFGDWKATGEEALKTFLSYLDWPEFVYIVDVPNNTMEINQWDHSYKHLFNRHTLNKGDEFHYEEYAELDDIEEEF